MIISHNNPKLAPLNQDDFKMKIVEDLGRIYPSYTSVKKTRLAIFECCSCKKHIKSHVDKAKKRNQKLCIKCASTTKNITHGMSNHKLYSTWKKQYGRCNNKDDRQYDYYGGRGVSFNYIFSDFKIWISYVESLPNAYKENYTIDRFNNDYGYEPMNLRWASKSTQVQNTRKIYSHNTSGYRGVSWSKYCKVWIARISINNKRISIKQSKDKMVCALAYDKYIIENNLEHTRNFT